MRCIDKFLDNSIIHIETPNRYILVVDEHFVRMERLMAMKQIFRAGSKAE